MDAAAPYDRVLLRYLPSVLPARLFVGDDLARAHWPGVEATFGPLLEACSDESILAFYDASRFGRGTKGFVVTDRHVAYVQPRSQGLFALEHVRRVASVAHGVRVDVLLDGGRTQQVTLRVDAWDALIPVTAWLHAVAAANAHERGSRGRTIPAEQALKRLETLVEQDRLTADQQAMLRRLVRRLDARRPA